MSRTKEIVTAVGTLACALGIGFAMQNTEAASQRYGNSSNVAPTPAPSTPAPGPQAQSAYDPVDSQDQIIDVQEVTLTSALPMLSVAASSVNAIKMDPPKAPAATTASEPSCDIAAAATPAAAATVSLVLSAPCHGSERVTIHHNGMFFTDRTTSDGTLALSVPALTESAVFIFALADGKGAIAETSVEDLGAYNRVVLQSRGFGAFELHAREFGADYGASGHVWHAADGLSMDPLMKGEGGYMHSLGRLDVSAPQVAQVYTFPANMSGRNGQIDLSIEAEITANNCGLEVEAQTLELTEGASLRTQNLTLAVPGCEAIGDYLVLNNVLEDMKVAAR